MTRKGVNGVGYVHSRCGEGPLLRQLTIVASGPLRTFGARQKLSLTLNWSTRTSARESNAMLESKVKHRDPPPIIPKELLGRRFTCTACRAEQNIDWLQKQPFPKESIASNAGDGNWVPVSFSNTCLACSHRNDIAVERGKFRGELLISADEAFRQVGGIWMFLLAGCGISPDRRAAIEAKIGALEKELTKDSGGRLTAFHAKGIMDSKSWPEPPIAKRLKYIRRMSKIAQTNRVSKFVTAGALRTKDAAEMRYLRDQVFSGYTMRALQRSTDAGIRPIFAFDEIQLGRRNGWAEECMIGIRRYPLFVWYSRGAHVADIEHVTPGSTTESKLADCLAFVTAREFERRMLNKDVDVDTRWYGNSQFSGYNGVGDLIASDGRGFPWRHVFGLKSAR